MQEHTCCSMVWINTNTTLLQSEIAYGYTGRYIFFLKKETMQSAIPLKMVDTIRTRRANNFILHTSKHYSHNRTRYITQASKKKTVVQHFVPAILGRCACHSWQYTDVQVHPSSQQCWKRPHYHRRNLQPLDKGDQGECPGTWRRCPFRRHFLGKRGSSACRKRLVRCLASWSHLKDERQTHR